MTGIVNFCHIGESIIRSILPGTILPGAKEKAIGAFCTAGLYIRRNFVIKMAALALPRFSGMCKDARVYTKKSLFSATACEVLQPSTGNFWHKEHCRQ